MINLHELPIGERIRLVEDLWDSIAAEQSVLSITDEQKAELDGVWTPTNRMGSNAVRLEKR